MLTCQRKTEKPLLDSSQPTSDTQRFHYAGNGFLDVHDFVTIQTLVYQLLNSSLDVQLQKAGGM